MKPQLDLDAEGTPLCQQCGPAPCRHYSAADIRIQRILDAQRRHQDHKKQMRAQLDAARAAGLRKRHATKLARGQAPGATERNTP